MKQTWATIKGDKHHQHQPPPADQRFRGDTPSTDKVPFWSSTTKEMVIKRRSEMDIKEHYDHHHRHVMFTKVFIKCCKFQSNNQFIFCQWQKEEQDEGWRGHDKFFRPFFNVWSPIAGNLIKSKSPSMKKVRGSSPDVAYSFQPFLPGCMIPANGFVGMLSLHETQARDMRQQLMLSGYKVWVTNYFHKWNPQEKMRGTFNKRGPYAW